jgi:hypothetical protein
MTLSTWKCPQYRHPVSGRITVPILSYSACSISRAQESGISQARISGTRVTVELMEIQDVTHQTIPLRIQDPGTATLVLIVRDLNATLTRAKQANATIATPGGKPVAFPDGTRAILIRDIDKRFIELRQPDIRPNDGRRPNERHPRHAAHDHRQRYGKDEAGLP